MSSGSLVLLDVDETLVDTNYELTVPHDVLTAAIRHAEAKGAIVGLNSDSGFPTLEWRANQAGISGPIIAERGALVQPARGAPLTPLIPETLRFLELRDRFLDALTFGQRTRQYWVVLGDVNELAKALPPIPPRVLPASVAVLVNGVRTCSLAFYVRKRVNCEWVKDGAALQNAFAILGEAGGHTPELWDVREQPEDINPTYGICIVHHRDTQKSRAVDWILAQAGDRPVYMIGNSTSDDLRDPRVIQCAVENAGPKYKARCTETGGFIAQQPLTAGVIELLERITSA